MMQAPGFWQDGGWPARLLGPFGAIYDGLGRLRWAMSTPETVPVPVLCVGNATVGGTGKTPVVLDLLRRLRHRGVAVHGLCRGHGGRLAGPVRIDRDRHGAADVGDEALLLAREAPTWAARDRLAGARAAVGAGAAAIVLDDGLQYPRLAKRWSLLVVDAETGLGNGRVIPAGPLRERFARALGRSDALVEVGAGTSPGLPVERGGRPRLRCHLAPPPRSADALRGQRVLAFAGIGRPEKLFASARAIGADVVETRSFADHHPYSAREIEELLARARTLDALPLTTAKDAVRLRPELRAEVRVLEVEVVWQDEGAVERMFQEILTEH
jgi:tetraacyldisaccharide 4'-kinase